MVLYKKSLKKFLQPNLHLLLIIVISLISFFIMLNHYQPPVDWDDPVRAYIVADHIVTFKEFPMSGHLSVVADIKNSAAYFYVLAFFLLIKNNYFFLGLINILLHLVTGIIIYYLGKELFGKNQGIIAFTLFSINPLIFFQTTHIWQPWVMQPVINLSFLMLVLAYKNKHYLLFFSGFALFIFAVALHYSAFPLTIVFLVVSLLILKKFRAGKLHYITWISTALITLFILYMPVFLYYLSLRSAISDNISKIKFFMPLEIPSAVVKNLFYFINNSFFHASQSIYLQVAVPLIIITTLFLYFRKLNIKTIFYSYIILCFIGALLLITSIIDFKTYTPNYHYYFTPVYGIFLILISTAIIELSKKSILLNKYFIILGCIYLGIFSHNYFNNYYIPGKLYNEPRLNPAARAIENDVREIKSREGLNTFNFFTIESFVLSHGWHYSAFLWMHLENNLKTKLVMINERDVRDFKPMHSHNPKYIYLLCPINLPGNTSHTECINEFLSDKANYNYSKTIYSSDNYSILTFIKN
jgi:hypothetical protein